MSSAVKNPHQAGNEEIDMWNHDYQKRRLAAMKRRGKQQLDCCDYCVMQLTKHLIHIFVLVIVVSFIGMGVLVMQQANAPDFDMNAKNDPGAFFVTFMSKFLQAHPAYYGLKNLGVVGGNDSLAEPNKFIE